MTAYDVVTNTNWSALSPAPGYSDIIYISENAILTCNVTDGKCLMILPGDNSASSATVKKGTLRLQASCKIQFDDSGNSGIHYGIGFPSSAVSVTITDQGGASPATRSSPATLDSENVSPTGKWGISAPASSTAMTFDFRATKCLGCTYGIITDADTYELTMSAIMVDRNINIAEYIPIGGTKGITYYENASGRKAKFSIFYNYYTDPFLLNVLSAIGASDTRMVWMTDIHQFLARITKISQPIPVGGESMLVPISITEV